MSALMCDLCMALIVPTDTSPGYAMRMGADGLSAVACYACAAWLAVIDMRAGKDPGLYAGPREVAREWHVTNWPGTLRMRVIRTMTGRHNMAGSRTTLHFIGPDGIVWTGTEYHGATSGNYLRNVRPLKGKGR